MGTVLHGMTQLVYGLTNEAVAGKGFGILAFLASDTGTSTSRQVAAVAGLCGALASA